MQTAEFFFGQNKKDLYDKSKNEPSKLNQTGDSLPVVLTYNVSMDPA